MRWLSGTLVLAGMIVLSHFLYGCANEFAQHHERWNEAEYAVWDRLYDVTSYETDDRPTVLYVEEPRLDCDHGRGFMAYVVDKNICVRGVFDPKSNTAMVARWLGARPSDTALAHELLHGFVHLSHRALNHSDEFQKIVDDLNDYLYKKGM